MQRSLEFNCKLPRAGTGRRTLICKRFLVLDHKKAALKQMDGNSAPVGITKYTEELDKLLECVCRALELVSERRIMFGFQIQEGCF